MRMANKCKSALHTALDKRVLQINIFLISLGKHTLWVLIRSASLCLMCTHNIHVTLKEMIKICHFFL